MPRTKKMKTIVSFLGTEYVINDLGEDKSTRFELYNILEHKTIKKSNNPRDFDDLMWKIWEKKGMIK